MVTALIVLGLVAVVAGLVFLSQATAGVGLIAVGCFLAILARIAQAAAQAPARALTPVEDARREAIEAKLADRA